MPLAVEVGDVGDLARHAQLGALHLHDHRAVDRPEAPREGDVLVLAQHLVGKDEHRVALEGVLDDAEVRVGERFGKIGVADFGGGVS